MKNISVLTLLLISLFSASAQVSKTIWIQAPIVNVRADQTIKSKILEKLAQLDQVEGLEQGNEATIDGVTDYWYKIKTDANTVGYVFGHLTSLKKAGQSTIIKGFSNCELGEENHLIFENIDFGEARNSTDGYDLCSDPSRFMGKDFELIVNNLLTRVYCTDGTGAGEICVESRLTIVSLRLK